MVKSCEAMGVSQISAAILEANSLRIAGSESSANWRRHISSETQLRILSQGVLEHDVEDQVVVVGAGTPISELQSVLMKKGQCLPLGPLTLDAFEFGAVWSGTVAGQLSMNLPHSLQADCGSWRDWVLGMTVVRPDGTVVKCGSKAVKSVAGYDVAKLMVGARGTLGVIAEVILRTYPLRALPSPDFRTEKANWTEAGTVHRVLTSDFTVALQEYGDSVIASHPKAAILYISDQFQGPKPRFSNDWMLHWGMADQNVLIEDETELRLMKKSKMIMDPMEKLNFGEFY